MFLSFKGKVFKSKKCFIESKLRMNFLKSVNEKKKSRLLVYTTFNSSIWTGKSWKFCFSKKISSGLQDFSPFCWEKWIKNLYNAWNEVVLIFHSKRNPEGPQYVGNTERDKSGLLAVSLTHELIPKIGQQVYAAWIAHVSRKFVVNFDEIVNYIMMQCWLSKWKYKV